MMNMDPRETIANSPMGSRQIIAVILCVLLNALDGFDVLSISFASPGIAAEWSINRAELGLVLAVELVGMAIGSILIGGFADRVGRRPTTLASLVLMGIGMLLASHATSLYDLSAYRLITGLGIGGMLACTNALVAEYANARARSLAVTMMAAGYPLGAIVGGTIASNLLVDGNWRDVFELGAIVAVLMLPLVWWCVPETVGFLVARRPANALEKVNRSLVTFGKAPVSALPEAEAARTRTSVAELFSPHLVRTTTLLIVAYFAHILTFYFILKWAPKIVVDMGHAASAAGGVLVWANVGGLLGSIVLSLLSWRIGIRRLLMFATLGSTALVALFGQSPSDLQSLAFYAAIAGFCTNAGMVGFYALIADSYPAAVRGGGTGLVIGIGRGGAALSPIIAGLLFNAGFELPIVAASMGIGSLVATLALLGLGRRVSAA
jgi:benzoate transport